MARRIRGYEAEKIINGWPRSLDWNCAKKVFHHFWLGGWGESRGLGRGKKEQTGTGPGKKKKGQRLYGDTRESEAFGNSKKKKGRY